MTPDKHPLLRIEGQLAGRGAGMFDLMNAIGAHELVTDTPEHVETWAELPTAQMVRLLRTYRDRLRDLRRDPRFRYVLVLKNRGAVWSRYPHSHSHVIATPFIPKRIEEELGGAREYYRHKERCAFCDQLTETLRNAERVVAQRGDIVSFTPFASAYPYETWISAVAHEADFGAVSDDSLEPLAENPRRRRGAPRQDLRGPGVQHRAARRRARRQRSPRVPLALGDRPAPRPRARHGMGHRESLEPGGPEDAARRLRDALPA